MAYQNNIYGNAAFVGAYAGMLDGRSLSDAVAGDYTTLAAAAAVMAQRVDALIAFDALVSTAAAITQLAITTNVIAANEQWRGNLLMEITRSAYSGRYSVDPTAANYNVTAAAIFAAWTAGLVQLVTP